MAARTAGVEDVERKAVRLGPGSWALSGLRVAGGYTVVGKKEGDGPLGGRFHEVWDDDLAGQSSWEAAEAELARRAVERAIGEAGWDRTTVDLVAGGDLLNQLYSTNFSGRAHQLPLVGLFSACATFTEAIAVASVAVASGGARRAVAVAASHHLAAERQFRYPIELGYQRTPTASWTATAAGALAVGSEEGPVRVEAVTLGRVVDLGARDPMDMGTAMAPAALDTLERHRAATGRDWTAYDRIYTGDLGKVGSPILYDLLGQDDDFRARHRDCGRLLYGSDQDVHNGGSGAGCAAAVFTADVLPKLAEGRWRRVLLVATGALFSPTSYQQGESIPCIAHAVEFAAGGVEP
jgi:stage V sporulation protein AD